MDPPDADPAEPADAGRVVWASIALVLIVLASRLPFLDAGYGVNYDAWRVAATARQLAETGEYAVSRFPGYPLHEYSCALLWRGGPMALNGLSALASALAALLLFGQLRASRAPLPWLGALTLAFVPVVFVNSVSAKDYVVALAFLVAALGAANAGRAITAGILLGLATGFRPASIIFGLPLAMLLLDERNDGRRQLSVLARFLGAALATACLAFTPVILHYGAGFLRGYPYDESWSATLRNATVGVWGALGCAGLFVATAAAIIPGRPRAAIQAETARKQSLAWMAGIIVVVAAFMMMPYQSGYLIPAIPLVILLLARYAPRWAFAVFCALTMASSFLDFGRSGIDSGAIFADRARRREQVQGTEYFVRESAKLPGKAVFVVGGRHALVSVLHPELVRPGEHFFVYLLDRREAAQLVERGYRIVCSEEVRRANLVFHGVDLTEFGAVIYDAKP
ncbi:hypothetical protein AYO41_04690 [Verrucomicrobia bacterium SCGC AG-212-E04]|nr:hypothetical protein AYO41_04690 [Verrucomicrobia bacterium SCGC AG-212-E04]